MMKHTMTLEPSRTIPWQHFPLQQKGAQQAGEVSDLWFPYLALMLLTPSPAKGLDFYSQP